MMGTIRVSQAREQLLKQKETLTTRLRGGHYKSVFDKFKDVLELDQVNRILNCPDGIRSQEREVDPEWKNGNRT